MKKSLFLFILSTLIRTQMGYAQSSTILPNGSTFLSNTNATAVVGTNTANGNAGIFTITNAANPASALSGSSAGSGAAVYGNNGGTGDAGYFSINNSFNGNAAVRAYSTGGGLAGSFWIDNSSNIYPSIYSTTNGTGDAGYFLISNPYSLNSAVAGVSSGGGYAGYFEIDNSLNTQPTLRARTIGTGNAGAFYSLNPSNTSQTVYGENQGLGSAGSFQINNASNIQPAIYAYTTGTGNAGSFFTNNVSNPSAAMYAKTFGTGNAGYFENIGTTSPTVYAVNPSAGATAIKVNTSTSIGIELENSSIKVSGTNKMAFQVTSAGANPILIPNTGFANASTDIIIVTHKGVAANVNTPVYVSFNGTNWRIFTENGSVIPAGEIYNVLVFKQ